MTISDVQIVHVSDVFGAPIGWRGIVRARLMVDGPVAVMGCTCPDAHVTVREARECSYVQQVLDRTGSC